MIRLIATDLDDTLLNARGEISPRTLAALREAMACGHGCVIDCAIDIDEMVRPMVSGGSNITQFVID